MTISEIKDKTFELIPEHLRDKCLVKLLHKEESCTVYGKTSEIKSFEINVIYHYDWGAHLVLASVISRDSFEDALQKVEFPLIHARRMRLMDSAAGKVLGY